MKKLFTLIAMAMMAIAAQASITIYVQAEVAPYLYVWNGADNGGWPGTQMTETAVVQGTTFWKQSFDASGFNIIFNNGKGGQTKDITGIISDRYFTYNGTTGYEDVTTQYGGEIPDATISSLKLAGNHTSPTWGDGAQDFTAVEAGKKYTITVDLTGKASTIEAGTDDEGFWRFKLVANGGTWFGYSAVTFDAQPNWLKQAIADDNFEVDLEDAALVGGFFTITATWGGGKQAGENWTVKVENSNTTGISTTVSDVKAQQKAVFNLNGQRVGKNYKGIVVTGGKKIAVK